MVVYDEQKISNGNYVHAYSDSGRYIIAQDGATYGHYWFSKEQNLHFEEGELIEPPDPDPELDDSEALEILLGGDGE